MGDLSLQQVQELAGQKGYLRSHLDLGLDTAGGPPAYHLGVGLSTLSVGLCFGDSAYSTFLDPLQKLYPHLYRISLGPTGAGKTRAERIGQMVLAQALPEAFLPGDFSREGLFEKLAQQPYGYLAIDEFRGFQERLSRDYNAGTMEFLTEAYDAPPLIKRRLRAAEIEIRAPRINLTAGSTLEWFTAAVREGDFEGGWLSRFLYISASEVPPLHRARVQGVSQIVESLAEHMKMVAKLHGPADFRAIEDVAWSYMEKVHSDLPKVDSKMRGFWARLNPHLCKLAMIFHASQCPHDLTIRPEDWKRAILLMDALANTVQNLITDTPFGKTARELDRLRILISQNGGVDRRTLLHHSHQDARNFARLLETLVQTGEAHIHAIPNPRGSPTTMVYKTEVCPRCSQKGGQKGEH